MPNSPITPAESCCCGCSLLQGVHTLSVYAMFNGIFSVFALVLGINNHGRDEEHGERMNTIIATSNLLHTFGIAFGIRGFIGLHTRNPEPLKVFMWYFPFCWVVDVVITALRQPYICEEALKPKDLEKECSTLISITWTVIAFQFFLYLYFAYVIWSLAQKFLSSGPHGLLGDAEIGLVPYAAEMQQVYYPVVDGGHPSQGPGARPPAQHISGRQQDNFAPFSGQAYQLT